MPKDMNKVYARCSFCGASADEVHQLIAGVGVNICDKCVRECMNILSMEEKENEDLAPEVLPTPIEMYDFLNQYVIGQDEACLLYTSRCV